MVRRSSGYDLFTEIFAASQHLCLLVPFFLPCRHCEWIDLWRRVDSFISVEQAFDRKNLDFWIVFVVPELRRVTAGIGSFGAHLLARFFKCDQHPASSFLVFNVAK